jgi:hypothetical protein
MTLARNNYQYEKRQKDIAKKKKQDEKRQKKLNKKSDIEITSENIDETTKTDEVVKE